ncbi:hypothetical protein CSW62_06565 [Caulobacter sp. FWC2]|nr:hypothetical protein CSW62_06565 [Caulobacter sp. FWC2]
MRLGHADHFGQLRIGELVVGHMLVERHTRNMSHGHILMQAEYVSRDIGAERRHGHNMPMGQSHFIREWRKHRGLSQVQLAERVQINQGNLSRIEKGTRKYDQEFLERAADALGCEPADLLKVDPKAQASEEIWDFYDKMSSTQKAQVVEIAKALLKVS